MEPYIGQIQYFASYFEINGWIFCDGRTLPVHGNEALYSLLGNFYGGNGVSDFKVPDLREKKDGIEYKVGDILPNGKPYMKAQIAIQGYYPPRN
jgi:microcystin-dependent protein